MMRPLYLRPDLDAEMDRLGYSQADRALTLEFAERGFVVLDLEIPEFDALARDIIEGVTPLYGDADRVQDAWMRTEGPRILAGNERVLDVLHILHGRRAFPFQTLNFDKGTEQMTHSDTIHFDSAPAGFMAGVWVALEDVDANNGPLHYYPGSHKLPQVTLADFGIRAFGTEGQDLYYRYYEPGIQWLVDAHGLKKEEACIRKGQALIWSANLLHGGSPILEKGRTRHSQVTHYYFEDCAYSTPLHSDIALGKIARRHPLDVRTGQFVSQSYLGLPISRPSRISSTIGRLITGIRRKIQRQSRLDPWCSTRLRPWHGAGNVDRPPPESMV